MNYLTEVWIHSLSVSYFMRYLPFKFISLIILSHIQMFESNFVKMIFLPVIGAIYILFFF